ncbi:unnamed protein product, partial [Amoebophrya sp. A120]
VSSSEFPFPGLKNKQSLLQQDQELLQQRLILAPAGSLPISPAGEQLQHDAPEPGFFDHSHESSPARSV